VVSAANAATNASNQVSGPEIAGVDAPMAIIKEHPGIPEYRRRSRRRKVIHTV